jgi:hypothetical protein
MEDGVVLWHRRLRMDLKGKKWSVVVVVDVVALQKKAFKTSRVVRYR